MASPFDPSFENLPREIPIFPLAGALLLPHGTLPLNIFEPRYLAMTLGALAAGRMIGMIQPNDAGVGNQPRVYRTGCAGRITSFSETDDGRFLITLSGICRFMVADELAMRDGYRRVIADYAGYRDDLAADDAAGIDREALLGALRAYLESTGAQADWDAIEETANERLVTSLAMMCPFRTSEKQALLEAPDIGERARTMVALLEMALGEGSGGHASH